MGIRVRGIYTKTLFKHLFKFNLDLNYYFFLLFYRFSIISNHFPYVSIIFNHIQSFTSRIRILVRIRVRFCHSDSSATHSLFFKRTKERERLRHPRSFPSARSLSLQASSMPAMASMAVIENDWRWLKLIEIDWNWLKWIEYGWILLQTIVNDWKWL